MNCCELWQSSTSKHSEHTATSIRKFIVTERLTLTLFTSSLLCWLQLDGRSELSHSGLSLFSMINETLKKRKRKRKKGDHAWYISSSFNKEQFRKKSDKMLSYTGESSRVAQQELSELMKSKMSALVILLNLQKFVLSGNGTEPTAVQSTWSRYFYQALGIHQHCYVITKIIVKVF